MKNLFKNLMLVAVAAMAFTACSQDNNEVNKLERKTVYNFQANIADDDTRSGFMEKEDGATAYKSEWFGDETVKVFVTDYNGYNAEVATPIDAEGKFELELTDAPESFFVTVVSPAESWASEYTANIPAEQTPLANSVDPKAHLLQSSPMPVSNGSAAISMTHSAAYGKMTVNGVDFEIDRVVIDLKGSYYKNPRELSYTINADNVENNTFWFATEPIDVAEFSVTAYDAEDNAVAKTVDVAAAGKTLSFKYGRVSTFSVSGLEKVVKPDAVMDSAKYYFDYNGYGGYDNWGYVVFEDEYLGTLVLNCTFTDGLYLDICTYSYQSNELDVRFDTGYSYYNQVGESPSKVNYLSTMTVDVVDGKYSIDLDIENVDNKTLKATYVGDIEGLGYPDLRAQLAMPNATATADGNVINISWEPVTGADEYYVFCNVGGLEAVTTAETSITYEAAYNTSYEFLIRAVAHDTNPNYRSSKDYYFSVTTEKDPNGPFADVVATNIIWDSSNGAFKMTGEVVSGTAWGHSSDYIRLYMNEADRAGNNSINVGQYTGCGGSSPQHGQFGARLCLYWGTTTYPSAVGSASTLDVTYDEIVGYTIILTHDGKTYGYKGMPEGWVAPNGNNTGEGGETPEPEIKDSYNVTWEYYFDSSTAATFGHVWNVSSGDGGFSAQISTDSRGNYSTSTSFTPGTFIYHSLYADGNYGSGMYFTMRNIEIEGVGYSNDAVNGVMVVTHDNGVYGITIDLYNYINGYTTDKITTLVGTFGSADSGSGDNTGDGDNTGGGGDTPTEDFSNWNYGAVINTSSGVVTLTDKTGNGRVVEFKLNEVAMTTFYGNTTRSNYFTDVKVDGVAATATPESWFKFARSGNVYFVEINMVINGVTYTGVAAELSF